MKENDELESYQYKLVQFIKYKFLSSYKFDKKEISRDKYAELSGISQGTLSRLKKGERYDIPTSIIYKLCKFEGISITELFEEFEKSLKDK
jgi:transcriptional regulator with XRE-family HTH domain